MKFISSRQSGSALLTVMLLMMAIGSIILLATKNSSDATRASTKLDNARIALQMARSGIEEGLLRVQKDPDDMTKPLGARGLSYPVYYSPDADSKALYVTTQQHRYFKDFGAPGSTAYVKCGEIVDETAAIPGDGCPFYDLSIHSFVKVTNTLSGKYYIPDEVVPLTSEGQLTLQLSNLNAADNNDATNPTPGFSITATGSGNYTVTQAGGTPSSSQTFAAGGGSSVTIDQGRSSITITKDGPNLGGRLNITVTSPVQIQTPYTYIETTGHAYGVQRKMLLSIPRTVYTSGKAPQKTLTDFAGTFDADGFMQ